MDLIKLQSNLSKLDVVDLAYSILDDMSDFIADLNRKRLAEKGEDSNSNDIGDYSEFTVRMKDLFGKGVGAITDHVTGYNTVESHRKIFASVVGDQLIVDTPTSQWQDFEERFNNDEILGLTKDEQKIVVDEFNKRFIPALENEILQ